MMTTNSNAERRQHPRVDEHIPLRISSHEGAEFVTNSANISRSGVYCEVDEYVEPMTKLAVNLLIPDKKGNKNNNKKVSCGGVVVRTEPIEGNDKSFYIAVFFNDISKRDAKIIEDYINTRLDDV